MVLGMLLVVMVLANVVIRMMLSQSRLTRHQVGRIQAYYATWAGINYAIEQLRLGNWHPGETHTLPFNSDDFYPASIINKQVLITLTSAGASGCAISVTANYTTPQ